MSIQARTLLRCSPRQVSMPHNLRFREQLVKPLQDITDSFRLLRRTSIAWFTMFIQTTLIADADRTAVVRSRMRPHFEQEAMLRHCPIPHKKLARALMPRFQQGGPIPHNLAKTFDGPPTLERSGSEHRRAVTSLALLERARAWEWVKDPLFARGGQGSRKNMGKQLLRVVLHTLIKIYTFAPNFKFGTK